MKITCLMLLCVCCVACGQAGPSNGATDAAATSPASATAVNVVSDSLSVVWICDSTLAKSLPDTLALGRMHSGEVIHRDLQIRNASASPLVILSIQTSCGCTTVEYPKKPIPVGGEAPFSFTFNSTGFSGWQLKQISIQTSLSSKPYRIILTADVE